MIFNIYQICIALSFASTLEHVQGWRIDRRETTTSSSSTSSISSNSSSSISSTSSISISSSSSSSSSSTSSSVESTSVLSLTEVVIPIKQSPAALSAEAAPNTSSPPLTLAVKSSSLKSQSVPSSTSTSSTGTSSAPSIELPQHVQSISPSSSSSTAQIRIEVAKTTSSSQSETSSITGSDNVSKTSIPSQTTSSTTSTSIEPPLSTITPGPAYDNGWKWGVYPWGNHPSWDGYPWPSNSTIPSNTCWVDGSEDNHGGVWWRSCTVNAWKVKLSYFPTNTGTVEYPHTHVDASLGITMVAPSIYLILETIGAANACGRLGPTYVDRVIAMNPADVYTHQGYADTSDHKEIGEPKVLNLSDLTENCDLQSFHSEITTNVDWTKRPLATDLFNKCSPRISWPPQIQSLGVKYWEHCALEGRDYGLFDPPGAVPPINGGLLATQAPPVAPQPSPPAAPASTAPLPQAPNTQAAPAPPPSPSPVQQPPIPAQPSQAAPPPAQQPPPSPQSDNPQPPAPQGNTPAQQQPPPSPSPVSPPPPSVSVVAVVAGNTISAQAGSPNVILPNGSTANVGAQVTIAVNNNNNNNNNANIVVSVGSSGIFVSSGNAPSTYYPNPVVAAQIPPTAGPNAAAAGQLPTAIATIGGEVISAAPGASTIVYKGQTLTAGGPPVTLAGTDIVATLGSTGLTVQGPGGSIATYSLPKPTASPAITSAAIIGTVNGEVISATAGASSIIVGGQTLKLGGSLITLSNHEVLSLGPSGIVVQAPGGGVRTIGSPSQTTALGPAVFIADIIGATKATSSAISTSLSNLPSPSNTWNVRPLNGTSLTTSVAASLAKPSSTSLSATSTQPPTQSTSTESLTAPKGPPIAVASNPGVSIAPPSSTQNSAASTLHMECTSIAALFSGLFCTYLLLT